MSEPQLNAADTDSIHILNAWIKLGLQTSGELLLTAAWSFPPETENINQKTARVILHLVLKIFHLELHQDFHPLSNWEIPARSSHGEDGARGMFEASEDSVGVKLLAIMSECWLHMFFAECVQICWRNWPEVFTAFWEA